MQHEITERKPLLDKNGRLTEPGWAKSLILDYDRRAIKAAGIRIKEWDYYFISNGHRGIALTIADNSYMQLDSISLFNFDEVWEHTFSPMRFFTWGKANFPSSSAMGDVHAKDKNYCLDFYNDGNRRRLCFDVQDFNCGKPLRGEIILESPPADSMVIATPYKEDPKAFYYNQKINCLPASGRIKYADEDEIILSPQSWFGVLDWGRGVWTYKNTWYWGSASGTLEDGTPFGFNLGYGFGDTSAASENMLFFGHKCHKLSQVSFNIPKKDGKDDFLSDWSFTSDDGRFEMDFHPMLDRSSLISALIIRSDQHQVFGRFSGRAVLDDGAVVEIKDFFGFAEKVMNMW